MAHPATGLSIVAPFVEPRAAPPYDLQYIIEITRSYNDILCDFAKQDDIKAPVLAALCGQLQAFTDMAFGVGHLGDGAYVSGLDFEAIVLARPCFDGMNGRILAYYYAVQASEIHHLNRFIQPSLPSLIVTDLQGELFDALFGVLHRQYPDRDMLTAVLEAALPCPQ